MAKHRIKKYSRRTASRYKKSKAPLAAAVIAFLLLSIIISVAVGISLSKRADESAESERRFDFDHAAYKSGDKLVTAVDAYNLPRSANAADYIADGVSDLSVCVRHEDGKLGFYFEAAELYSADMQGTDDFSSLCKSVHDAGGRVCAYMYVTSFGTDDEYLRGIEKAYELALISNIAESGADDILLLGLSPTSENIKEIEDHIARASIAADKAPLGVAVNEKLLSLSGEESYLAPRLRETCDYIALDLTHLAVSDGEDAGEDENGKPLKSRLELTLEKNEYYIKSYPLRLLFSAESSELCIPAHAMGAENTQTVAK